MSATPRAERAALALGGAVLAVVVLAQDWGVLTPDTKPEAFLAPWRTVGHTAAAWQDSPFLGAPNFNVGLVPVTLATGLLSGSGFPAWLLFRTWRLLLLLVAAAGARAFYRDVTAGTPADRSTGRVVAAVAFVANPYLLLGGATTPTLLPMALLPWFLLALRRGFATPRGPGAWRGPAAAALLLAAMAGINAGVVPLLQLVAVGPLLLDAHRREGRRPRDLALVLLRTAPLLLAVSLYWLLPALAAVPVGTAIAATTETTSAIASTSSWAEVLRGLGMWTMYGADAAGPFQPHLLAYLGSPVVVAGSFAVPVLAAVGALVSRSPVRRLAVGFVATAAVVMVGLYPPADPSPFGRALQFVFDHVPGTIALRTTNKAGGVLVLGTALLVALGAAALADRLPGPAAGTAVAAAAAVAVAATGPAWTGDLYGTHIRLPDYWTEAARAVDAGDRAGQPGAPSRVLLAPGIALARYRWGYVGPDELGNSLFDRPTVFRSAVPSGAPAAANLLAGTDARLQEGTLPPGALSTLARYIGAGDVLLRGDGVWELPDGARPGAVLAAATADPGLRTEQVFGGAGQNTVGPRGSGAGDDAVHPLTWLSVAGGRGPVRQVPQAGAVLVDGDGEALPDLVGAGLLRGDPALLYAGAVDDAALPGVLGAASRVVLTDTNRRAVWNTHVVAAATGPLLHADQDPTPSRALFGAADQTVAVSAGPATVSQTGTGLLFGPVPYGDPPLALDGDPTTAWLTGNLGGGVGDALVVTTGAPVDVPRVTLRVPVDAERRISAVAVTVSGPGGSWTAQAQVPPGADGPATVELPAGARGTRVEVRVLAVTGGGIGPVGIAELTVPGLSATTVAALPTALPGRVARLGAGGALDGTPVDVLLRRRLGRPDVAADDEEPRLQRDLTLPVARTYRVEGHVRLSGSVPERVVQRLLGQRSAVTGEASSRAFGNPALGATSALDLSTARRPDLATAWQPAGPAVGQWLEVAFPRSAVDAVTVTQPPSGTGAATVDRATVSLDGGPGVDVRLGPGRVRVPLPRTTARTLRLTIRGVVGDGPVRLQDLTVGGVRAARPSSHPRPAAARCLAVATVDGAPLLVRPTAPVPALADGAAVPVAGCDGAPLQLAAGRHSVRGVADWAVDDLHLADTTLAAHEAATTGAAAAPEVLSTSDTGSTVRTPPTAEPTYLVAGRAFDPGWTARADGADLGPPVLVDGYSAGWRLPAGAGHVVEIAYGPRTEALAAGVASGASVAGCALLALPLGRRRRRPAAVAVPAPRPPGEPTGPDSPGPAWTRAVGWLVVVAVAAVLAGPVGALGALAVAAWHLVRPPHPRVLVGLAAVVLAVVPAAWLLGNADRLGLASPTVVLANPAPSVLALLGLLLLVVGVHRDTAGPRRPTAPAPDVQDRPQEDPVPTPEPRAPLVSVVVPTRNVGRTLRRCLESVRAQDHPAIELVVVDNFSDDDTFAVALEFADVAVQAGPERSAQRNLGIEKSSGEWVLYVDADMVLEPDVVSDALATAQREGADAVFVPETSFGPGFWTACRALERRCYVGQPLIEAPRLVRRSVFDALGGFVPQVAGQEDAELRMRLLAAGTPMAWSRALIHHDEGRLTLGGVLRKRVYYGRSIPAYAAEQPGAVRAQGVATVRALVQGRRLLARDPLHAAGLAVLRTAEAGAYAVGAGLAWREQRRAAASARRDRP